MHRLRFMNWTGEKLIWITCAMFFTAAFGESQRAIRRNWLDVEAAYSLLLSFLEESVYPFHTLYQNIRFPSHVVGNTFDTARAPSHRWRLLAAPRGGWLPQPWEHEVFLKDISTACPEVDIYTCYTMDWPAVHMCHVSDLPKLKAWQHL